MLDTLYTLFYSNFTSILRSYSCIKHKEGNKYSVKDKNIISPLRNQGLNSSFNLFTGCQTLANLFILSKAQAWPIHFIRPTAQDVVMKKW